jgi:hypothetical protein
MISFSPAMSCQESDCHELTTVAMLEVGDNYNDIPFHPVCPSHGYAFSCSLEQEYQSISRFVLSEFDGQGTAQVLAPCALEEVPGYSEEHATPEVDSAWSVAYTDTEGKQSTVFCVWCVGCLEFYLHTFDD